MKSNYLFFILFLLSSIGFAQCIGTFQYPSSATVSFNDGSVQEITDCNFGGDFTNINGLIIGGDYKFTSSVATDYFTLTDQSNNVIASGLVPLVVNAIAYTNVRLHIHSSASCGDASGCRITTIQCTSCSAAPAPDCATNPTPEDGALNVPYGNVTFSWDAPTTGPPPTSYNIYAGESPTGDDFQLIATVTTTSVLLTIGDYDFQYYWMVRPVNASTEAVGCSIWTFTSEMVPDAPDCASNPNPADGAVNVPYGDVTFTWDAPTTGPTPTSYNLYGGETPSGDDYGLIVNVPTNSADLTIAAFDFQLYWIVKPVNGTTEAVGCPVWTFTTEMAPDPPANDNVCDAITLTLENPSSGGAYSNISATIQTGESGGSCWYNNNPASQSVWFSFVAPASGAVRITTIYLDGTLNDTQLALYSLTNCNDFNTFTELACDEDDDADVVPNAGLRSLIDYAGLTSGNTYYIQVDGYSNNVGTFDIGVFDLNPMSVADVEGKLSFTFFPNPVKNELTLKAQSSIQNVSIYNLLGQEVLRTTPNALVSNVNMNQLQTGSYFVKVTINDTVETIRIIKQ